MVLRPDLKGAMNVLLLDIDSTLPNLALMKLSAWHKAQGDEVSVTREVSLGEWDRIYASAVYTWSRSRLRRLVGHAQLGGHGWDLNSCLPPEVEAMRPDYELYGITYGLGYLTRGCQRRCPWCDVWKMWPQPQPQVVATWDDLLNPRSNFVVLLDDNFLSCFWRALEFLQEAIARRIEVCFTQGLDIRMVTLEVARLLARLRFWNTHRTRQQLTVAFDSMGVEEVFRRGVSTLHEGGVKPWQIQSFFLCGYDTTFEEDMARFRIMRELGVDPFCMVYRAPESGEKIEDRRLHHFARWVNRRLYKTCPFDEYEPYAKEPWYVRA